MEGGKGRERETEKEEGDGRGGKMARGGGGGGAECNRRMLADSSWPCRLMRDDEFTRTLWGIHEEVEREGVIQVSE